MQELLAIMRRLRAPGGCPWDQEQTHQTLRPYLLEEAAEAADAISAGDLQELPGELGDVLLQVAFHSVIAEEAGTFSYADVERKISEKLVRRHPHVFGSTEVSASKVSDSAEVVSNWQAIKIQERGGRVRSLAEQIPSALGALAREAQAQKLTGQAKGSRQQMAAALANADGVGEQEISEVEIGKLLAAAVALARAAGIDPEVALRAHTAKMLTVEAGS
jgi:MazG family protein